MALQVETSQSASAHPLLLAVYRYKKGHLDRHLEIVQKQRKKCVIHTVMKQHCLANFISHIFDNVVCLFFW